MATTITEQDTNAPKLHRQQFSLPQLPTTSVTIYPARAAVVRTIKGVTLKPGRNEIILHQLTPAADENSIKVSGRLVTRDGERTKVLQIADMTVDLVKPPATPSLATTAATAAAAAISTTSADAEDVDGASDEDLTISDNETPTLSSLSKSIKEMEIKLKDEREAIMSAKQQLRYLERWGDAITCEKPSVGDGAEIRSTTEVENYISSYAKSRMRLMSEQNTARDRVDELEKRLSKENKVKAAMVKKLSKQKQKARDERKRIKEEERERRREEGNEESINADKDPEKWYRVRVWIDREDEEKYGAFESGKGKQSTNEDVEGELEITYTVSQAGWVSRYDIVISSSGDSDAGAKPGKPTAHLTYHAHFQNRTFETWKDALITLSTSQTAYTGLTDAAPVLEPWKVQLVNWANHTTRNNYYHYNDASAVVKERSQGGLYSSQEKGYIAQEKKEIAVPQMQMKSMGAVKSMKKNSVSVRGKRNASAVASSSAEDNFAPPRRGGGGAYASVYDVLSDEVAAEEAAAILTPVDSDASESEDDSASVAETLTPSSDATSSAAPKPQFVTQGLTSSYLIPHPMTIPSSHTTSVELNAASGAIRRHTILTIPLTNIQLSYVSTPKLRAAAYLKARIMNVSTTTLRKGAVGITLDGTFIGSTTLARTVYPGTIFSFPLGIDESVTVNYAKPTIKRHIQRSAANKLFSSATWGRGHQEMIARYGRSTIIRNNRLDRGAIELVVIDQVPVSEDGKLIVVVTWPRGLRPPAIPMNNAGGRRGIDEGEVVENDGEGGDEGASQKLGVPIRTGTGVYVEGFQMQIDEALDPVIVRSTTTSNAAPATTPNAGLLPPPPQARHDEDNNSAGSNTKGKRSFFRKRGSEVESGSSSYPVVKVVSGASNETPTPSKRQSTIIKGNSGPAVTEPFPGGPEEKWGSAVAAMRRNGEVVWKVKLNPGMGVRLGLEYECRVPAGEVISGL